MTTNCKSQLSSQNTLIQTSLTSSEDRKRTGRYVAGGTALAVTLLALHHVLMRGSSNLAGIFVPAVIMTIYVIWVLYSARRDSRKAALKDSGIELLSITANRKGDESENSSAAQTINKVNKVNKLTTIDELKK